MELKSGGGGGGGGGFGTGPELLRPTGNGWVAYHSYHTLTLSQLSSVQLQGGDMAGAHTRGGGCSEVVVI